MVVLVGVVCVASVAVGLFCALCVDISLHQLLEFLLLQLVLVVVLLLLLLLGL